MLCTPCLWQHAAGHVFLVWIPGIWMHAHTHTHTHTHTLTHPTWHVTGCLPFTWHFIRGLCHWECFARINRPYNTDMYTAATCDDGRDSWIIRLRASDAGHWTNDMSSKHPKLFSVTDMMSEQLFCPVSQRRQCLQIYAVFIWFWFFFFNPTSTAQIWHWQA